MKKIMKILVTTLCLCLVTACGARDKDVNLEKSGTKYSTDDGVSFYYPSNYEITANATDTDTVEFSKDNDTLYFKVKMKLIMLLKIKMNYILVKLSKVVLRRLRYPNRF